MLASIRAVSKLPVTIVTDNYPYKDWHLMPDVLKKIDPEDCYDNGKFSPAKAKLSLWKYSDYDETIFLDVDGLLLKELDFDIQGFMIHVNGFSSLEHDNTEVNLWVKPSVLYNKYKIPEGNKLAGTNSSFMSWDKTGVKVLQKALGNLSNPVPLDELRYQWGKSNCQPDELYINVALAQLGIEPEGKFLYTRKRRGGYAGATEIMKSYVLCCWGGLEFNAHEISGTGSIKTGLYNKLCFDNFKKLGLEFIDHFYSLINDKIYAKAAN